MFYCIILYLVIINTLSNNVNAKLYLNIVDDGTKTTLDSYLYVEEGMQNFTSQLKEASNDNMMLRSEIRKLHINLDAKMEAPLNQLSEIKALLEKREKTSTNAKLPTSCAEALKWNNDHKTGEVYTLKVPDLEPFDVYCLKDPYNGPAWTIIQRRWDGTIDFYREWSDYKNGFGNLFGEYWLGLERIHALTKAAKQQLWIRLEDFDGDVRHARYNNFVIGDAKSKYVLSNLGTFSGDAGDSFEYHLKSQFSTKDNDNDASAETSCAKTYSGAWWFKNCSNTDLNAPYNLIQNEKVTAGKSIRWHGWRGRYSMKQAHMAIRPVK